MYGRPSRKDSLANIRAGGPRRQQRKPSKRKLIKCPYCQYENWLHQRVDEHIDAVHRCRNCNLIVSNLDDHECHEAEDANIGDEGPLPTQLTMGKFVEKQSAHRGVIKLYRYVPPDDLTFDEISVIYDHLYTDLYSLLVQLINHFRGIRVQTTIHCQLFDPINERETDTYLTSFSYRLCHSSRINSILSMAATTQIAKLDEFLQGGSIWTLEYIYSFDVSIGAYEPFYRPGLQRKRQKLPKILRRRQGLLNFKTRPGYCFHMAFLASVHFLEVEPRRRSCSKNFERFQVLYDFTMLTPPVTVDQLDAFESQNQVGINVFACQEQKIFPVRICEDKYDNEADLIITTCRNSKNQHYIAIVDFDKFINFGSRNRRSFCKRCLNGFSSVAVLEKHKFICAELNKDCQVIQMPEPGTMSAIDNFRYHADTLLQPGFGVYDFESYLRPVHRCTPDPDSSWECKVQQHEPMSYSFIVVLQDKTVFHKNFYCGRGAVDHFLQTATMVAEKYVEFLKTNEEIEMSDRELEQWNASVSCELCNHPYDDEEFIKVRHHFHTIKFDRLDPITGDYYRSNYLGSLCAKCNLRVKHKKRLTLLAHNASAYDLKLILANMRSYQNRIKVIPRSGQRFIQLLFNKNLRFIDSYQFLNFSLSTLTCDLLKDGEERFTFTRKEFSHFSPTVQSKLFKKLAFPYSFLTDERQLEHRGLPSIEHFYDDLTKTPMNPEEYEWLCELFTETGCTTLGDMAELYNKLDVALLADVLYAFVTNTYKNFGIDPFLSPTISSMAFKAMRLQTKTQWLDILTDIDAYYLTKKAVRGGITNLVTKLCYANTPAHPQSFDPQKPGSEILLLDVNSLYPYSLTFPVPIGNFSFLSEEELECFDVHAYSGNDKSYWVSRGAFVLCDLDPPEHDMAWFNLHASLPLGQQHYRIEYDDLGQRQKDRVEQLKEKGLKTRFTAQTRQILSFLPLRNHCLYSEELRYYLERGMILRKVHKALVFDQKPFLKNFIEKFANARAQSTVLTEKKVLKLILCSIFGRFLLNIQKFVNIIICTSRQQAKKLLGKHTFKAFYAVHENLSVFTMGRSSVQYRQLFPIGACCLSRSKIHFYQLYYNNLLVTLPNLKLLSTDTDSYFFWVEFRPGENDLSRPLKELANILDFSSLDADDPLYSTDRAGQLGLLKFETGSRKIIAFASEAPKSYFLLLYDPRLGTLQHKTASKGIPNIFLSRRSFEEYKNNIFRVDAERIKFDAIRTVRFDVCTMTVSKVFYPSMYTHRYVLSNGIDTLPFNHPAIRNLVTVTANELSE